MVPSINEPGRRIGRPGFRQVQRHRAEFTSHLETTLNPRNLRGQFKAIRKTAKLPATFVFTIFETHAPIRWLHCPMKPPSTRIGGFPAPTRDVSLVLERPQETEQCAYALFRLVHIDFMAGTFNHRNPCVRNRVANRDLIGKRR